MADHQHQIQVEYDVMEDPLDSKLLCVFDTFAGFRYLVGGPNQYIARTGAGIKDISVERSVMKKPFQRAKTIDTTPRNYEFDLHAMSNEKMEFILPGVFTIGPNVDPNDVNKTKAELKKYATFLIGAHKSLDGLIKGIIEGETRVLAAGMSIEDIFKNRAAFKKDIIDNVHTELEPFGLKVFNANIKELADSAGSEYFVYMRQKTKEGAMNQAKIDIADAKMKGTVGATERDNKSKQFVAGADSETKIFENSRTKATLESDTALQVARIEFDKNVKMADIAKVKQLERRDHELSIEVEQINQKKKTEQLRATNLSASIVNMEVVAKQAEASAKQTTIDADANFYAQKLKADGELYKKKKEAEGIQAVYEAEANGLNRMVSSFNGDQKAMLNYMMIQKGTFEQMANASAKAVQGLNPKVTIWNTGNGADNSKAFDPIKNILQTVPPMMSVLQDQLGYQPPGWMGSVKEETPARPIVAREMIKEAAPTASK